MIWLILAFASLYSCKPQGVIIIGVPGVGKTSAMKRLSADYTIVEGDAFTSWSTPMDWYTERVPQIINGIAQAVQSAPQDKLVVLDYPLGPDSLENLMKILDVRLCIIVKCRSEVLLERRRSRHTDEELIARLPNELEDWSQMPSMTIDTSDMSVAEVAEQLRLCLITFRN